MDHDWHKMMHENNKYERNESYERGKHTGLILMGMGLGVILLLLVEFLGIVLTDGRWPS